MFITKKRHEYETGLQAAQIKALQNRVKRIEQNYTTLLEYFHIVEVQDTKHIEPKHTH